MRVKGIAELKAQRAFLCMGFPRFYDRGGEEPPALQFLAGPLTAVGIDDTGHRFGVAVERFVIVNRHGVSDAMRKWANG